MSGSPIATGDDEFTFLRSGLARGTIDDAAFDALYAEPIRSRSGSFWTPVAVATRAAELLAIHGARRIVDVGSGAGKFCLTAACVCPDLDFVGIEQRADLVAAACLAQACLCVDNVLFLQGDATIAPWAQFDGLYLYNPFGENLCEEDERMDHAVELSTARYMTDVRRVAAALTTATVGTCVVTYHGFGGPIPLGFELVHAERAHTDWLRLWVKRRPRAIGDTFYVEQGDDVVLVRAVGGGSHLEPVPCTVESMQAHRVER
jgi:predicted RNA methylase